MRMLRWKWQRYRTDTLLIVEFEHCKLRAEFHRKAFHTRWDVNTHSKLGAGHTIGLSLKQACRIMRRAHGEIVARLFAGLEV